MKPGDVFVKLDFKNEFNTIYRDQLMSEVRNQLPDQNESVLLYHETEIKSSCGVQQGDPLGPALFSIAIQPIVNSLCSNLNIWYLDDGTLGGPAEIVLLDL